MRIVSLRSGSRPVCAHSSITQVNDMKSIKFLFAAALMFGMGFGFTSTASARIASCLIDAGCMGECGAPYEVCRQRCCV